MFDFEQRDAAGPLDFFGTFFEREKCCTPAHRGNQGAVASVGAYGNKAIIVVVVG